MSARRHVNQLFTNCFAIIIYGTVLGGIYWFSTTHSEKLLAPIALIQELAQ